ncbi:MAG: hypothetical protein ACOYMM_09135 [Phycisphaerales bacterium]
MILATIATLLALQAEPPAAPPATTPPPAAPQSEPTAPPATEPPATTPPATTPPAVEPPVAPPATPPSTTPDTPPTTTPDAPATTTPGAAPSTTPATPPAAEEGVNTPINPAGIPSEAALPEETPKRAYLVVDRVSVAAGMIESDDDAIIVLRDDKGRIKSFSKNRLISVTYLLEGPAGRRVRVVFNDGRVIVGALIEDGYEHVELEISGIKTKYPREAVSAVRPYPTDRELYERFRTTLEPDQYGARYTLAVWLYNKKMYAESKTELESLLEATNHYDAKKLLNEVNAQLALMEGLGGGVDRPVESGGNSRERPVSPRTTGILASPLLSDADVNLIRVYELDVANPPRLQVPQSLIRTMLERYADSDLIPAKSAEKTAFFTKEPIEIVKTLFALKARDLYGEIRVLGEPEPLNLFRLRVHNAWLIGNCATSKCHGGADAGRFFLHNREWKDDNVRYTNMLILLRSRIDTLPLIDPEKPTDSLIFQYALPKTEARRPHPDVRGWSPVLTSGRRGLQEDFVDWIRSMRLPRGDYPIEYTPPALQSPDRPAETGPDR